MKGLQAFYPNAETLARDRDESGPSRGVRPPALPLEIFLDVRSEARDYDRIILKTDAALESDKFNHLRMPRGLEWPNVNDEMGQPITHLKSHTVSRLCGQRFMADGIGQDDDHRTPYHPFGDFETLFRPILRRH
jgi:hypothetical protein